MNLLDIRKQFVKISGRYDMVRDTVDYLDNGANFYIQSGQSYLERKVDIKATTGRYFIDIVAGDFTVIFPNCRSIQEVWIADSSSRLPATKVDMDILRGLDPVTGDNNYVQPFNQLTGGRPSAYSPAMLRRVPEDGDFSGDSDTLESYLDTSAPYDSIYNGILIMPPANNNYVVEVIGLFNSIELDKDTDENIWTRKYANLLVMSALRQLEIMFRGSKSVSAWDNALMRELMDIEKDLVDEESTGINQMEG